MNLGRGSDLYYVFLRLRNFHFCTSQQMEIGDIPSVGKADYKGNGKTVVFISETCSPNPGDLYDVKPSSIKVKRRRRANHPRVIFIQGYLFKKFTEPRVCYSGPRPFAVISFGLLYPIPPHETLDASVIGRPGSLDGEI